MKDRVVLVTGGFDPLHSGHIEYFKEAKKLGSKLIVGLNSDEWLTRKKGRPFMPIEERAAIIKELAVVDKVISFDDSDGSACGAIFKVLSTTPSGTKIIFANGGDRTNTTTPEYETYGDMNYVEFVWGVGGEDKKNSSSWILEEWKNPKTIRSWGWYRVLDHQPDKGYKVKELVIAPGKHLSDQRHKYRNEHWYVLDNEVTIALEDDRGKNGVRLEKNHNLIIGNNVWHKAMNDTDKHTHILEVQFGELCEEEDIERRD